MHVVLIADLENIQAHFKKEERKSKPANIYLLKFNNRNTRKSCKICSICEI